MPNGPELSALAGALGPAVLELVDHLPGTMFCVKGADGRYIAVNPTFVERTNKRSRAEVLGRRAGELFVAELADRYEEQDARVHLSGRPLFNELELIRAPGGPFRWHVTAKVPLRDEDGRVTGVVSMSQDVGEGAADDRTMTSLGAVVAHIRAHLGENVTSQDLARVAGCSVDTLEPLPSGVRAISGPAHPLDAHRRGPRAAHRLRHAARPDRRPLRLRRPGGVQPYVHPPRRHPAGPLPQVHVTPNGRHDAEFSAMLSGLSGAPGLSSRPVAR